MQTTVVEIDLLSKTWTLEPLAVVTTADLAIITAGTRYEERETAKTTATENWLTLAFRKENGTWRLVHDQDTRASPPDRERCAID